jgi:hypothetical protein
MIEAHNSRMQPMEYLKAHMDFSPNIAALIHLDINRRILSEQQMANAAC